MSAKIYNFIVWYGTAKNKKMVEISATTFRGAIAYAIMLCGINEKSISQIKRKK